jgi:hypothetical protein
MCKIILLTFRALGIGLANLVPKQWFTVKKGEKGVDKALAARLAKL